MFKTIIISSVVFSSLLLLASCDDDSACANNFNFTTELAAEFTALNDAALLHAQDPTPENCNAYKASATAYLDAASELKTCAEIAGQGIAYAQAIADTQAEVDNLMCN
ncbi:MAG: hypothetical protein AAGG68_08240 [Bacteroidota bacterium]